MFQFFRAGGHDNRRGNSLIRWILVAGAAISLSGCGLPPIITIASIAMDAASYASTGKSVADHGLSLVLQRDCALLRVVEGAVCVAEDEAGPEVALAELDETPGSPMPAGPGDETPIRLTAWAPEADFGMLDIAFVADPMITPARAATAPATD